jgi:tetratricopeptide (TPR) repeat protein
MELYERALVQEKSAGDLHQAIGLYERVARNAGPDRALAAKALVRAAECYEKLGLPKAAELYAEVARSYPEQRESVRSAQIAMTAVRGRGPAPRAVSAKVSAELTTTVVPMLDNYCIGCHNQERKIGGLALDSTRDRLTSDPSNAAGDAEVWEKVVDRLQSKTMPPLGRPHPDASTNQTVIGALSTVLDTSYPPPILPTDLAGEAEIAARMAKLIWNSDPDSVLLDAANRGRLSDPGTLQQQVKRMLQDPRSENLVNNFFEPWLHLPDLMKSPLTATSPAGLDDPLRQSMRRETQLFLLAQMREDRSPMQLWTANYTFVNDTLAQYYGIGNITGNQFRRVTLSGSQRSGLLGQGSILTLTSIYAPRGGNARTSPTIRGKWLYATFFGLQVPPPPPSVSPLDQDGTPSANMRDRMDAHHKNASCASCHQVFEPFGIALENFDVMGRFREQDGGEPVNPTGSFADGTGWLNLAQFKQELSQYQDTFNTNVTAVLLSYALGRTRHNSDGSNTPGRFLHAGEMPAVRAILRDAASSGYSWSSIIAGIIRSQPFQMKTLLP